MTDSKTHYRKAFNSPYLSSADIVGPTILTIKEVRLEIDKTKKTKDLFNTAYFVEDQLRPGEKLKPMILNAHNSGVMRSLTGSHYIEDWQSIQVTVYVNPNVKFGRDTVEGLRISPEAPRATKQELLPTNNNDWTKAVAAYKRDGNLNAVLEHRVISPKNQQLIKEQAAE